MRNISLNEYGPIISDKPIGDKIYLQLNDVLSKGEIVTVDLENIRSMATYCAKQIFGRLYLELGPEEFFKRIKLINANDDVKLIIRIGIQNALQNTPENEN